MTLSRPASWLQNCAKASCVPGSPGGQPGATHGGMAASPVRSYERPSTTICRCATAAPGAGTPFEKSALPESNPAARAAFAIALQPAWLIDRSRRFGSSFPGNIASVGPTEMRRPLAVMRTTGSQAKVASGGRAWLIVARSTNAFGSPGDGLGEGLAPPPQAATVA